MAFDGYIILDERRSILNLILLIVSGKNELHNINQCKKDCLIAISTEEKLRLEDAKLTLFLFFNICNNPTKEVTVENYLKFTGRTMKNVDPIRRSVKRLGALKIIYLDHNGKRQEQRLLDECKLNRGKIIYQIHSFFKSKLNKQGRGHRNRELYGFIFKDEAYRAYRQNGIHLILKLSLLYGLDDLDMIDRKKLDQEEKNIKALLDKYFEIQNPPSSRWIKQKSKEFLDQYNHPPQG